MENAVDPGIDASQTSAAETELISADEQERFLSILNFWHKIEFFIPFDLDGRIAESGEDKIRYLPRQNQDRGSSTLWQVEVQEDEEVKRFHVYLCIFDKSEIARVCDSTSRAGDDEEFERTELEGRSCFARLTVDPRGELLLESKASSSPVSYVSTLPWALDQYQKAGLASLTFDSFENAKQNLAELLLDFKASRRPPTRQESGYYANPLTHSEIVELHDTLQNWAGFSYKQAGSIGIVEIITGKKPRQDWAAEKVDDTDEPDCAEDSEPDIAILNSFFVQDIENAIKEVKSGQISRPLKSFLLPLPVPDRVDLDSPTGLRAILDTLHPSRTNLGRWLSNADRPMTLMQQFAANMVVQGQASPPLFSVNGPPGTGKTTFLRDIFADLIVSRARVLAKIAKPRDAFLRKNLQVSFKRGQNRDISVLRPELTGFEIVVASSNNAAVENISGDLPKAGKLGSHWSTAEYLKPVAYKVAAQEDADSFKKLSDSDQPWGLISCALGNSNNRHRFKERFCYMEVPKDQTLSLQLPDRPQNIREWIDNYRGPTFRSASTAFGRRTWKSSKPLLA